MQLNVFCINHNVMCRSSQNRIDHDAINFHIKPQCILCMEMIFTTHGKGINSVESVIPMSSKKTEKTWCLKTQHSYNYMHVSFHFIHVTTRSDNRYLFWPDRLETELEISLSSLLIIYKGLTYSIIYSRDWLILWRIL